VRKKKLIVKSVAVHEAQLT